MKLHFALLTTALLSLLALSVAIAQTPSTAPSGHPPEATSTSSPAANPSPPSPPATRSATQGTGPREDGANVPAVGENVQALKTYARGDYAAAADMLEKAYRAGKTGIQDRLILARAYLHLGKSAEALAVLKNVLESDKDNPAANSLVGEILLKSGKNADALKYLEHAYRLKPDPVTASALGRCHYALGNSLKAKSYLSIALQEDIRDPSNSFLLGRIHLDRGSGALAEKYFLMAQEAGLDSVELHLLLGKAYLMQEKRLGPVMLKRMAGAHQPGDIVDACVVLGKVPGAPDQYKVCTRFCALYEGYRLLQGDKLHSDGLFMVASGWFAAGDNELAAKHLKTLMEKPAGATPAAWELQARLLVAMKDVDGLQKTLADGKAAKAFDSRAAADYLCLAASALRAEGKGDQAIALLKKAEQEQPTAQTVLRPLAAMYTAAGDDKHAVQYYSRIVELFPDATDIDELRNALKVLQEKTGVQQ